MLTSDTIPFILAIFISGTLSSLTGGIIAHLVFYRRRGQAKSRKRSDGKNDTFVDLIKRG